METDELGQSVTVPVDDGPQPERRRMLRNDDLRAMKAALLDRNPQRSELGEEFPERRSMRRGPEYAAMHQLSTSAHQFTLATTERARLRQQWHVAALGVTASSVVVAVIAFLGLDNYFAYERGFIIALLVIGLASASTAFIKVRRQSHQMASAKASIRELSVS